MTVTSRDDLGSPTEELVGEELLGVPQWAQLITLLWGMSRARTGRFETARYRDVGGELKDLFDEYLGHSRRPNSVPVAATWLAMGNSTWWSTDLRPPHRYSPEDVVAYNSTGGLCPAAVEIARDEDSCGDAVLSIVQAIPFVEGLETVLGILDFDRFVEFRSQSSPLPTWPGLLDVDLATGSHSVADAASAGDWDALISLISKSDCAHLVNSWRPGGVSLSTPLHQAARQGAGVAVVKRLIEAGAWRGVRDAEGLLPLDYAVRSGHEELIEILAPPEVSPVRSAVLRALEEQANLAVIDICTDSDVLRVPRFRPPQLSVLEECGGVLVFALSTPDLALHLWVDGDELFVAYWWDSSETDGSVRVYGPEGERRELPWDGTFKGHAPDVEGLESDDAGDSLDTDDETPEPQDEPGETEAARPIYSGLRILVGTSRRFGPLYVLSPRAKYSEVLTRPEANAKAIGIVVRRTGNDCEWAVLGRGWRYTLPRFQADPSGEEWTDLILMCALFKRNALSDRITAMAEFWADTGLDPLGDQDFAATLREGLNETDFSAVVDRWRPFASSMENHGLAPSGAFGKKPRQLRGGDAVERAPAAMGSVRSTSTVGTPTEFETALPMSLSTSTAEAKARWNGESMLVLRGSRAALMPQPKFSGSSARLRDKLVAAGKMVREGDSLIFIKDHRFSSPSAAASVLCGCSQNGRELWFDDEGRNINDIEGGVKFVRANG